MTNPHFGFIGPCDRCGSRMTYALVCKSCERMAAGRRPEEAAPRDGDSAKTPAWGKRTKAALSRVLRPPLEATAHCDLPCGVYDPAQARIEAESVKAIQEKYQGSGDPEFRSRAIEIKEQRSDLVKHHLWVLWTDYFKPPHFEKYPELHELFNKATKKAGGGAGGTKSSTDPATGQELLDYIAQIDKIFWETKQNS